MNSVNISPIIRLPSANDEQRQPFDRERAGKNDNEFVDRRRARPESSEYVFRGEVLRAAENDKPHQSVFNQQIDPQNRAAISNYQSTSIARSDAEPLGLLIDRFI